LKNAATPGASWKRNGCRLDQGPGRVQAAVKYWMARKGHADTSILSTASPHTMTACRPSARQPQGSDQRPVRFRHPGQKGKRQRQRESADSAKRCSFRTCKDKNTDAILAPASKIVTADPHAYNALKNDYRDMPPVEHISQFMMPQLREGALKLKPRRRNGKVTPITTPAIWAATTMSTTTRGNRAGCHPG
jgi:hypothetical protein